MGAALGPVDVRCTFTFFGPCSTRVSWIPFRLLSLNVFHNERRCSLIRRLTLSTPHFRSPIIFLIHICFPLYSEIPFLFTAFFPDILQSSCLPHSLQCLLDATLSRFPPAEAGTTLPFFRLAPHRVSRRPLVQCPATLFSPLTRLVEPLLDTRSRFQCHSGSCAAPRRKQVDSLVPVPTMLTMYPLVHLPR